MGGDQWGRYGELFHRYTITVLADTDIPALVEKLANNLNGLLRFSVDAYYSTKSEQPVYSTSGEVIDTKMKYGIVYPNTWGSVNNTELIANNEDLQDLLGEIQPGSFQEGLLRNTFHRRDVYTESNVRLHRILAYQIICTSLPPSWRHQ
jgi:hypothetical protein